MMTSLVKAKDGKTVLLFDVPTGISQYLDAEKVDNIDAIFIHDNYDGFKELGEWTKKKEYDHPIPTYMSLKYLEKLKGTGHTHIDPAEIRPGATIPINNINIHVDDGGFSVCKGDDCVRYPTAYEDNHSFELDSQQLDSKDEPKQTELSRDNVIYPNLIRLDDSFAHISGDGASIDSDMNLSDMALSALEPFAGGVGKAEYSLVLMRRNRSEIALGKQIIQPMEFGANFDDIEEMCRWIA